MKTIRDDVERTYRGVVLYIDDLERLFQLIAKNCQRVKVGGRRFELEGFPDITELENLSEAQLAELEIRSGQPYMSITFSSYAGLRVTASEATTETKGLIAELDELFRHAISPVRQAFNRTHIHILIALAFAIAATVFATQFLTGTGPDAALITIMGSLFTTFYIVFDTTLVRKLSLFNGRTIVRKERRGDAKTFFQRHKDQILVESLKAIATGAIGAYIARLF